MSAGAAAEVGDWGWLCRTGGALTLGQRLRLSPALVRTFGDFIWDRFRLAMGWRRSPSIGLSELWPTAPDSLLARQAEEAAHDLQTEVLVNHGYRTWVLGSAFAVLDHVRLEPELFHSSALLHDVGLESAVSGECFTHRSAEAAQRVADKAELDADSARRMMDAIGRHITPGLTAEIDPMGFYLQVGAMSDLLGMRLWQLPAELVQRTNETYPRLDCHRELSALWRGEAKAVPNGRAHYSQRWGRFADVVKFASI